MQAYRLRLALLYWRYGLVPRENYNFLLSQFSGPQYAWMGVAIGNPKKQFDATIALLRSGKYIGSNKYFAKYEQAIYEVLRDGGHMRAEIAA